MYLLPLSFFQNRSRSEGATAVPLLQYMVTQNWVTIEFKSTLEYQDYFKVQNFIENNDLN